MLKTRKKRRTKEGSEKVDIIIKHTNSWWQCGLVNNYSIMIVAQIRASLIKVHKKNEEDLDLVETASTCTQLKQKSGFGIGVATVRIEGHHEYWP